MVSRAQVSVAVVFWRPLFRWDAHSTFLICKVAVHGDLGFRSQPELFSFPV